MLNPKSGNLRYYAFKASDDPRDGDDPMIPGICTICGALVPGWNVEVFHENGIISPAYLHQEAHRKKGELE